MHMAGTFGFRFLVACVASAGLAVAIAEEAAVAPQSGTTSPAVAETRSVSQLRKDMRKAQDRFITLYNKLNLRREEHVTCTQAADTGSRLTKRSCSTEGERDAAAQEALTYMATASDSAALAGQAANADASPIDSAAAGAAGQVSTDTDIVAGGGSQVRGDISRRNLEKLLAEHADLRQAAQEYTAASQRYEAAVRRR
jgi:hypothetical protein